MPTNYTGNEANITPRASVVLQEPVDGDSRNAASVNAALSKCADLLAHLETRAALLNQANTFTGANTFTPSTGNGINTTATGGFTGLVGTGGSLGVGVAGFPGTAATASTPQLGVVAGSGYFGFNAPVIPNSTTAIFNTVTPVNIIKAQGSIFVNGSGSVSVSSGMNISSVSLAGGDVLINFAQSFMFNDFIPLASAQTPTPLVPVYTNTSASQLRVGFHDLSTGHLNLSTTSLTFNFLAVGRQ